MSNNDNDNNNNNNNNNHGDPPVPVPGQKPNNHPNPQQEKICTKTTIAIVVGVLLFLGAFITTVAVVFGFGGNDDDSDAPNKRIQLNRDPSLFQFEGSMGFLRMIYQDELLCVTYFENWRDTDLLLMECGGSDPSENVTAWFLEQQTFVYRPDTKQIVLNSLADKCLTYTVEDNSVTDDFFGSTTYRPPTKSLEFATCLSLEDDNTIDTIQQQQWYPEITQDGIQIKHDPVDSFTTQCLMSQTDFLYNEPVVKLMRCEVLGDYNQGSFEYQLVQTPETFFDPGYETTPTMIQTVLPDMMGVLQSAATQECITVSLPDDFAPSFSGAITATSEAAAAGNPDRTKPNTVSLQDCHYGDNQLFQFEESNRQWQSVANAGQCLSLDTTRSEDTTTNEAPIVVLEACLPISLSSASANSTLSDSLPEPSMDTATQPVLTTTRTNNGGEENTTSTAATVDTVLQDGNSTQRQQQWYYDDNGMIYYFPSQTSTSFCMQVKAQPSQATTTTSTALPTTTTTRPPTRLRNRQLKRMSSGGGGGGSSSSSSGSSSSGGSSNSYGGGASTGGYSTQQYNSGRPFLGGTSSSTQSATKYTATSGTVSGSSSTGGEASFGGSSSARNSPDGFPSSFGNPAVGSSPNSNGAFRTSHPTYSPRIPGAFYIRRNRIYNNRDATDDDDNEFTSQQANATLPASELVLEACRSQFDNDPNYSYQQFSFLPREKRLVEGKGSIQLGKTGFCLAIGDEEYVSEFWPDNFQLVARPCNNTTSQLFQYDATTGMLQGTNTFGVQGWSDMCARVDFRQASENGDAAFMANCYAYGSYTKEEGGWEQDSQGRLRNAFFNQNAFSKGRCLDWNVTAQSVVYADCRSGGSQVVFWEPESSASSPPSPQPVDDAMITGQVGRPASQPSSRPQPMAMPSQPPSRLQSTMLPSGTFGPTQAPTFSPEDVAGTGNIFERPAPPSD